MAIRCKWAVSVVALVVTGCGEARPKPAEIRPVRTVVVDPMPIEDDRRAVGEIRAALRERSGFPRLRQDRVAHRRRRRHGQEGRPAGPARRPGLPQQAEIGGGGHRGGRRGARRVAQRRSRGSASCSSAASPRAPTTTPPSRICAPPRPSSNRPRPRWIWPRTSSATPNCTPISTASSRRSGPRPARSSTSGRWSCALAQPVGQGRRVLDRGDGLPREAGASRPKFVVTLLSNPGITADGVVREVSPVADPTTRTYQVKVDAGEPARADAVRRQRRRPPQDLDGAGRRAAGQRAVRQGRPGGGVGGRSDERHGRAQAGRRQPLRDRPRRSSAKDWPRATSSSPPGSTGCASSRRCAWPRRRRK